MVNFLDTDRKKPFLDDATEDLTQALRPATLDKDALSAGIENVEVLKTRIKDKASAAYTTNLSNQINSKEDPSVVAASMADGEEKLFGIYSADDIYVEDSVIGSNPGYKAADHRYYRNLQIFSEEIEKAAAEQEDRSWVGYAVDFVDREVFRQAVFGMWEDATNRTARQGAEFAEVLFDEVDPTKAREFIRQKVNDIRSEGILTSDNYFAYNQLMREAYSFGYNPDLGWDRAFAALDIAGGAATVLKAGGKLSKLSRAASLKSTTVATRAGSFGGVDAADEVSLNLHIKETDPLNTANRQAAAVDTNPGVVRPSAGQSLIHERKTQITERISPAVRQGAVPDEALKADWDAITARAAETFEANTKATVYTTKIFDIDTTIGSVRKGVTFSIGKGNGKPFRAVAEDGSFRPESGAVKKAEKLGGSVVPLNPDDLSQGFVVDVSEALDPRALGAQDLDLNLASSGLGKIYDKLIAPLDNSVLGGAMSRGVRWVNELALRSENASRYLVNAGADQEDTIAAIGFDNLKTMNRLLNELQLGKDSLGDLKWDDAKFKSKWFAATGTQPTEKIMKAFYAAESLSDTAWNLSAADAVKDAVSKGFKNSVEVEPGIFIPARRKRLELLKDDDKIVDLRDISGTKTKKDLKALGNDLSVWELSEPWKDVEYFAMPTTAPRPISHMDVYGYAAYGRRTNPELQYFTFYLDDKGRVKTLLGAKSKKDADIAQAQMGAIQKAYKEAKTTKEIDDVIAANNDWNLDINNKADMDAFLTAGRKNKDGSPDLSGIDRFLNGKLSSRFRDAPYENTFDKLYSGGTVGDMVVRRHSRSDDVLTEFGGAKAYNPDPIDSIVNNFGSQAHKFAWNAYTYQATQSWLATAKNMMDKNMNVVFEIPRSSNPRVQISGAVVTGTSPEASRMRELQGIIKRQLAMKTDFENQIDQWSAEYSEKIFDATGFKLDLNNPVDKVKQFGFIAAFTWNPSQLFVQSWGMSSAFAIAGMAGLDGAVGQIFIRKMLRSGADPATEASFKSSLAKRLKLNDTQAEELIQLFQQSLPNVVTNDIMEIGTATSSGLSVEGKAGRAGFMARKFGKAFVDVGAIPFNLGDTTMKSTAHVTAALEFLRANPKLSLLSEAGRDFVARRSSTLSTNMTASVKSRAQEGLWSIPTQWLPYFFRSFEQVFVGRDLTKMERARLGFMLLPFYGMTGLGLGWAADQTAEFFGWDPESDVDQAKYITLKYGFLDGFLNYFTPFDVALGERLAPIQSVFDIYDKFTEENVASALGGPTGNIIWTGAESMFNLVSNLKNGYTTTLTEDTMRALRTFSGVNNVAKAVGILQDEMYRNRKGLRVPVEMDATDALISFLGFTPIEVVELYGRIGQSIDLRADQKKLEKQFRERSDLAWSIYANDPERASQILQESRDVISKMPITYDRKLQLLRLLRPNVTSYKDTVQTLIDNDRKAAATWAESILGKGE
jgi:hypothetical protein